jgi:protein SDA1
MGLKIGTVKQRKFGEEEVGGIEGLELLEKWKEEEKKRKRLAKGLPETAGSDEEDKDEEDGYNSDDWEVDSDDSSESGDWINVEHSDDEAPAPKPKKQKRDEDDSDDEDEEENAENKAEIERISTLATTTILTPADLAKLQELRTAASIEKTVAGNRRKRDTNDDSRHADDGLTAENIEAPARLRKLTKEERVELAREGKPNREEHKSTQAIRKSKKEAAGKSTSNKEKARKKNFLMTLGKAKSKHKRSLVETRKVLRGHVERSSRGGRRRNGG